ncbi:glycogen debranching protein GlgX [Psychromicrobium lacuslunae]|uniref:Glycogen debranching protein n=1 Tax=Psychromicrobium lacuslunae TaxID=1618207 RepID=A0A0D4C1Z9_9MICC|nr:glycogen debranching protein GlgX [Psychromicrobium lacuslunae]AJT42603.1 glycogen debranching protein [Psychromicrobium lacuslunae]
MTEIISAKVLGAATSRAFPLGLSAPLQGDPARVVNVAVWAPELTELVLYFKAPDADWQAITLPEFSDGVHHGVVENMPIGSRYGFAAGDVEPADEQLLLDPYARAIDDAEGKLLGVRMFSGFDWSDDSAPHIPWRDSVIYEAHIKGLTQLHPEIPEEIRGSYAGLAHPAMIKHLTELGVTAVELLPIHAHLDEQHLRDAGLPNYWGYNTIGYFAPQASYASAAARAAGPQAVQDEFKGMVKLLHAAGIEVILDVVYNHTAEGKRFEPTLSWRGLAEKRYYRFHDDHYLDTTGCGNTLDFSEPKVIQMALDSLRYWVEEFHIDGFRFDLAVTLGRDAANNFNPQHPFLVAASTDRVLSGVKLISEPWDVGHDGWQTGRFPVGWADWNDHFRDSLRDFWLADQASIAAGGNGGGLARLADALSGSSRLFAASGRSQLASVNMVTAHDGFTLADLVAYNGKHNEDNREENRDGSDNNRSWNHGVEGATDDAAILSARAQSARNLMATLILSLGVPMLTAGDELGKTQRGNNNAYCQDNEISWLDWSAVDETMLLTTRRMLRLRREYLSAQPSTYPARGETSYLHWFDASGQPLSPEQWQDGSQRVLQMLLGSPDGLTDGLVVFNATASDVEVTLPGPGDEPSRQYEYRFSTSASYPKGQGREVSSGQTDLLAANTITIYRA